SADFDEMIRTSLHLLLGTLAIRRGAVLESGPQGNLHCLAAWGLEEGFLFPSTIDDHEREFFCGSLAALYLADQSLNNLLAIEQKELLDQGIEVVVPMVVRSELTGLILLGGKASGEAFSDEDLEIVRAMVRHIGVGIHTHRLLGQLEQRAEENRNLYEELRGIYRSTVRAFAAAIDIKDKYTQGHSERVGKYSEIIAREMGWQEEEVEGIAIAGYLHDVGKLV